MTSVLESLNAGLHKAMRQDERVVLIGEDLLDPYGGAFKVSKGLSSAFPARVLATPISEAGFTGLAAGMALRGLRPVVEIMFGDFLTLAADQIINHISKFRYMYNDQVRLPLVIRTPMGGRRGYGPTHSQTLEKHYLGVPGLRVLAPCALGDPGELLAQAILQDDDPVLFVENKLLYLQQVPPLNLDEFEIQEDHPGTLNAATRAMEPQKTAQNNRAATQTSPATAPNAPAHALDPQSYPPTYTLRMKDAPPPQITLAAYGYMASLALQAVQRLAYENEIFVEVVIPTQLSPFEIDPLLASAQSSGRLLVVEEGGLSLGWGAEILAQAAEALGPRLQASKRLAAADLPIPAAVPLEMQTLPGVEQIIRRVQTMVY